MAELKDIGKKVSFEGIGTEAAPKISFEGIGTVPDPSAALVPGFTGGVGIDEMLEARADAERAVSPPSWLDQIGERVKADLYEAMNPETWTKAAENLYDDVRRNPEEGVKQALGAVPLTGLGKLLSAPKRAIEIQRGAKAIEAAREVGVPITDTTVGRMAQIVKQAPEGIKPLFQTGGVPYKSLGELVKEAEGIQVSAPRSEPAPVGRPIKVPARELQKSDFDLLSSEIGAVDLSPLKGPVDTLRAQARSGFEYVESPYKVLSKDITGNGDIIYRRLEEADRAKAKFLYDARKERLQRIKIQPGSESSATVGELLDTYAVETDIPSYKWGILSPDEKEAYRFYRQKWDEAADVLIDKGLLDSKRKIKSYLFRIFDKDTVYEAAKRERDQVLIQQSVSGLDSKQTAILKERLGKLDNMIQSYEKTGTILYDYIPKELEAPFLKERTGGKGYSLDSVTAFDKYENYLARKIFDEPAVQEILPLLPKMHPEQKEYARWFVRKFLGMEKEPALNNGLRVLTAFEYYKDMGFNVRSALVNSTQNLNTIVEIGPRWTAEGAYRTMFDPEAKALWKASGHALDVPSLRYGMVGKATERFGRIPWYLFDKMETANRATAYVGGYYKALSEGASPVMAKIAADNVVRDTQFIYGRVGAPRLTSELGGPLMMQYSTYAVKQLEFLKHLWATDPKKLVAYMLLAGGIGEGLDRLGVDMTNALGVGIDFKEMWKGMLDLSKGNVDAAKIHGQLGLPKIFGGFGTGGSGIFPEGVVPVIGTLRDSVKGEWEKLIPLQAQRMIQSYGAFREGRVNALYPGMQGEQVSGYPWRDVKKGEARAFLEPWEVVAGSVGPRPSKMKEEYVEGARARLTEETLMKLKQDALLAFSKDDQKEFNRLTNKYGLMYSETDFNKLIINKFTTPLMRKRLGELKSSRFQSFQQKIEGMP